MRQLLLSFLVMFAPIGSSPVVAAARPWPTPSAQDGADHPSDLPADGSHYVGQAQTAAPVPLLKPTFAGDHSGRSSFLSARPAPEQAPLSSYSPSPRSLFSQHVLLRI